MNDYLNGLNEQQHKAVTFPLGKPLLVVAGAGTGKTKTLTSRVAYLIKEKNIVPSQILAVTFTNKAAREMWERVEQTVGRTLLEGFKVNGGARENALGYKPIGKTFHSLGVQILREQHEKISVNKYFKILDTDDKKSLVKQAMKFHDIDPKVWEPRKISSVISRAKGDGKTWETFKENKNPLTGISKLVWEKYEELKSAESAFDFDDLLSETYFLLKNNAEVLEYYQKRWKYILIDEYQDTNTIQYKTIRLLVGENKNIFVVGDGDQNIYSWRGADMRNILNFEKDFVGAETIILETNYRSTKNILSAAHEIISKNTQRVEKVLRTDKGDGDKIIYYEGFSGKSESSWVATQAKNYIDTGTEPRDIAVLFRTNFQSRLLEEAFLNKMIPYQVVGTKFFSRKEIKHVMAYLRAALNPESLSDIKRIINEPKRGIGKVSVIKIFAGQTDALPAKARNSYEQFQTLLMLIANHAKTHLPSETIKFIIEQSGFKRVLSAGSSDDVERLENMQELVTYSAKYDTAEKPFETFLEEVALLSDQDSLGSNKKDSNTVKLMTIHASKGLEFKHVFVVGLEQGLFPSDRDDSKNKHEDEEERRLCYVAFTRAKKVLHVSYAKMRTIYGQQRINEPSEFLRDLPDDILEFDVSSFGGGTSVYVENDTYIDDNGDEKTSYLSF
ncbi:MAG: UvrD-helicase domain-containing protein [Candidatus Pacebacteria bacterium]|nr:UvrD-helicase domain-containing protein [Candidatus Paceibacterota bacterium]